MPIMTVPINDTLRVHVCDGDDPHLLIDRLDAGLVRIEADEIREIVGIKKKDEGKENPPT